MDSAASTLSPQDSKLLQAWFMATGDIATLSHQQNLPVADILRWSESPAVRPYLDALQSLTERGRLFRQTLSHITGINGLEHVCRNTTNLIELRRAATTLLKGPTTPRERKASSSNPRPPYQPLSEGGEGEGSSAKRESQPVAVPTPEPRVARPASTPVRVGRADSAATTLQSLSASHAADPSLSPRPEGARPLPGAPRGSASKPLESVPLISRPGGPTNHSLARNAGAAAPHAAPPLELLDLVASPLQLAAAIPRAP